MYWAIITPSIILIKPQQQQQQQQQHKQHQRLAAVGLRKLASVPVGVGVGGWAVYAIITPQHHHHQAAAAAQSNRQHHCCYWSRHATTTISSDRKGSMTAAAWWLAGLCVKASKLLLGLCGVVGAVLSSFSSLMSPHDAAPPSSRHALSY